MMRRLVACFLGLSCVAACGPNSTRHDQGASAVAFVDVTVLPMDLNRVEPHQTVVVTGDRIVAVGPSESTLVPLGAEVIDGHGRYLMPGLVDMHVHLDDPSDLLLLVANGVTTVRNMFGTPDHVEWRDAIVSGERLGPTIVTAGPIVDGSPAYWEGSVEVTTPDEAREAVRRHVEGHYDFVKVYNGIPAPAYQALVSAAHEAGFAVDGHVPDAVGLWRVLAAGQRTTEHLVGFEHALERADSPLAGRYDWVSLLAAWGEIDRSRIPPLVREVAASGGWVCPTLITFKKWLPADQSAAELEREWMRFVPPERVEMWRRGMPEDWSTAAAAGNTARAELTAALADAGVGILLGTDAGNLWVAAGFSVHQELAELVSAGLSPYQALSAATRLPAEALRDADEFGAVLPGLRADLLLVEASPMDDVGNAVRRVGVMVRGRWYEEQTLQARLAELARSYGRQ